MPTKKGKYAHLMRPDAPPVEFLYLTGDVMFIRAYSGTNIARTSDVVGFFTPDHETSTHEPLFCKRVVLTVNATPAIGAQRADRAEAKACNAWS